MPSTIELAEHLLKTASEHEAWSLVESPNSADRYEELRQWAAEMTISTWAADVHVRPHYLGLVLLWLETEEHAPEEVGAGEFPVVRLRLGQMTLRRPRQWGACCSPRCRARGRKA
jgi:hypothetical protein